jgi:hypothetical protein
MWDPENGIPTQNWFSSFGRKNRVPAMSIWEWKAEGVVKDIKINWRELFQSSSNGGSDGVCQINQMCSFNLFLSKFLFCDFNRVHSSERKKEKKFERNFRCYVRLRVFRKNLLFAMDKVLIKMSIIQWWIRRSSMYWLDKFLIVV